MEEMTMHERFQEMEVGDKMRMDVWDIWRVPTGWVMAIDMTPYATSVFVPDVLNVESHTTNHY